MIPLWLLFGLLSPNLGTVGIFVDKFILAKAVKNYQGMALYSAFVAGVLGFIIWIIAGFPTLSFLDTLLILFVGVLSTDGVALYYSVIQEEHGSDVIILLQLIPVFVLLLSSIFLHEKISIQQFIGFILILLSAFGASNEESRFSIKIDRAFIIILLSDMCWAIGSVLFKFVSQTYSFYDMVSYESFGWFIGGVLLFLIIPPIRNGFISTTRETKKTALLTIAGNEIMAFISKLIGFFAITLGPVSLVSVLSGSQIFSGIIFGWVLSHLIPKVYKESTNKKDVGIKLAWAVVMFIGIVLIY